MIQPFALASAPATIIYSRAFFLFLLLLGLYTFSGFSPPEPNSLDDPGNNSMPNKEEKNILTVIRRTAKNTVTPVLLNHGDVLEFTLRNGQIRTLKLLETDAAILRTNVKDMDVEQNDGGSIVEFTCKVLVDGHEMTMQRYLPAQESFYEPYVINGIRIWFDAVQDYFDFFTLKHGWAKPRAAARFAVSDALDPVAPDIGMWYPNDSLSLDVADAYLGDDVWMGPYLGGSPHAGLDINTPKGTPLFAPVHFTKEDDQWLAVNFTPKPYYWAATMTGIKKWPNGAVWTLTTLHLDKYLVEEHAPLELGEVFGEAAGTGVGAEEHSHFEFMIRDEPKNTVDGAVMVNADVLWEEGEDYLIRVDGINGYVPKSTALYIRRDDRPKNYSVFMLPKELADRYGFNYEIPQIPMDPWLLFWQMFENEKAKQGKLNVAIKPFEPAETTEKIKFSGEVSPDAIDRNNLSYHWTFGDGGYSNQASPEYAYAAPGIYAVTLVVEAGKERAQRTQLITVDGTHSQTPAFSLRSVYSPSFDVRKPFVMDVYGSEISLLPHTLYYTARPTNPRPEAKQVVLEKTGGRSLAEATYEITYKKGKDWAWIVPETRRNQQTLAINVDASNLHPDVYSATVTVTSAGALNTTQTFDISLEVKAKAPEGMLTIDDRDPGFFASPYFWVGSKFKRWVAGHRDFFLTNGGRARAGEYIRFSPDVKKGKYKVSFVPETPFNSCRFKVLVHSAEGDSLVWMEPERSRTIGVFDFNEGMDGFVQVFAEGSEGEVLADAVRFERLEE